MLDYTYNNHKKEHTIVFLHGFLGSSLDFTALCSEIGTDFNMLLIDLPGHGKSKLSGTPDFNSLLDEIDSILDHLKISKTHFVGYSMGGRVLLQYAKERASRVLSCVVLSAHYGLSIAEHSQKLLSEKKWIELLKHGSIQEFLERWYAQDLFSSLDYERTINQRKKNCPYDLAVVMSALSITKQKSFLPFLEITKTSFLFLSGISDKKYTKLYKKLPETISRDVLPNAGHAIHIENPRTCAQTVTHFIKEVSNVKYRMERLL
ncbi:MAG: 2-succinyl-6-hydroxy-2,4-cyclohexadiene-1-carboxylate synthase [Chlamydiia bacterium]|nr:2-succinyl-6-hydroxy-2,4-cyclohexadiene-1-carboxylate synthase [Chlamydiia bacterium]